MEHDFSDLDAFAKPTRKPRTPTRAHSKPSVAPMSCLGGCGCILLPIALVVLCSVLAAIFNPDFKKPIPQPSPVETVAPLETPKEGVQEPEGVSQAQGTAPKANVRGYTRKDGTVVAPYQRKQR